MKKIFILVIMIIGCYSLWGQQDSRYDAAFNQPFNEKMGDLNPQTGNIDLSFKDLSLPGRGGLSFQLERIWSLNKSNAFNMYRDPVDGTNKLNSGTIENYNHMGAGWTTTLPYIFEDLSSGSRVLNLFYGQSVYEVDQSGIGLGDREASNLLGYDFLDKRIFEDSSISYGDFTDYLLSDLQTENAIADQSVDRNEYLLVLKDNTRFFFREDGKLMMEQDKTGLNRIWFFYDDQSRLILAVDTIGRKIRFSYDVNGNLEEVEWDVTIGKKDVDGTRYRTTETRSIRYLYESAEIFTEVDNLKNSVIDYKTPYILTGYIDPMGNLQKYEYTTGTGSFTFDSLISHSENVYLLLNEISVCYTEVDGKYKSRRVLEYEVPAKGLYQKFFYQGYMEYYKVSGEYNVDRNGRRVKDSSYVYYDDREMGNYNEYKTVIRQGGVKTTYTYPVNISEQKDHLLSDLLTETDDGFSQLKKIIYNQDKSKELEEVYRQGALVSWEKFLYDDKFNLKRYEDSKGLVNIKIFDDLYNMPLKEKKIFTYDNREQVYEGEIEINALGQVTARYVYLPLDGAVLLQTYEYDAYGNTISMTNAKGETIYTVFDQEYHLFPIKNWQEVTIDAWSGGGSVHDNWKSEPDSTKKVRIRSWKVYNSDGTIWIAIDNEGYAVENYYDFGGLTVENVNPDGDDYVEFALPVEAGDPQGLDFDNFLNSPGFSFFLESRNNNPGNRIEHDYQNDFVKTYSDIDLSLGWVKVVSSQQDGVGNVEEEIIYNADGSGFSVKRMVYDTRGNMIATTDPDASSEFSVFPVNGTNVERHDKTWIIDYDDLGRKTKVIYPSTVPGKTDIKRIIHDNKNNTILTIDPEGRRCIEKYDWYGNLIETQILGGAATPLSQAVSCFYEYDPLGRRTRFIDPMGNEIIFRYDELSHLVEQDYGNGSDFMVYNNLGQLVEKRDRKGQIFTMNYDELGRNLEVKNFDSQEDFEADIALETTRIIYDNRGNAVRISNPNLLEHYIYDYGNQVIKLDRKLKDPGINVKIAGLLGKDEADLSFSFDYTYYDNGAVKEMIYPDGGIHQFEYDPALGFIKAINEGNSIGTLAPFVTGMEYSPNGSVRRMDYSNGTYQNWDFDNRCRISNIKLSTSVEVLEDLSYGLNSVGDILSINENRYSYDGFGRLVSASTLLPGATDYMKLVEKYFGTRDGRDPIDTILYDPSADINSDGRVNGMDMAIASTMDTEGLYDLEAFEYDSNGNRTKLIQNGDIYTYTYGACNRLEKVNRKKKDSAAAVLFAEYEYDENGNTTTRRIYKEEGLEEINFTYNTANRLLTSRKGSEITRYHYDNAGNRFIKEYSDGTTVLYLRHGQLAVAMDIEVNGDQTQIKGTVNRYVLSGDLIAGRISNTINADSTEEIKRSWYHLDHLNSTKTVTDESGGIEVNYTYRAFGEHLKRLDSQGNETEDKARYSYSGKELDDITDLYYFNARYYDAALGRFITVDPVQDGLNWYLYCKNNPLKIIDPTGLQSEETKPDQAGGDSTTSESTESNVDQTNLEDLGGHNYNNNDATAIKTVDVKMMQTLMTKPKVATEYIPEHGDGDVSLSAEVGVKVSVGEAKLQVNEQGSAQVNVSGSSNYGGMDVSMQPGKTSSGVKVGAVGISGDKTVYPSEQVYETYLTLAPVKNYDLSNGPVADAPYTMSYKVVQKSEMVTYQTEIIKLQASVVVAGEVQRRNVYRNGTLVDVNWRYGGGVSGTLIKLGKVGIGAGIMIRGDWQK